MRPIDGDALADVLTAISSIKVDTGRSEEWAVTVNAARQAIAQMPTIEPKKGTWEIVEDYQFRYECPVCHGHVDPNPEYIFCPYCGADMRTNNQ